ncbi:MAG: TIGR03943 family protein [Actinobacteria bacterium]|nr:TIGR03943 family protein [Actinomycetota bacterium]
MRITWSDLFLNYVREPMRPLLLAAGVFLTVLGIWSLAKVIKRQPAEAGASDHGHDHTQVPKVAWLLLLPVAAIFLVAPPPLGADAAERDSGTQPLSQSDEPVYDPLPAGKDPVVLNLDDYAVRALFDEGRTLVDHTVAMDGFVTTSRSGDWYLTRFVTSCCAADASAVKVQVVGTPAPPVEQWVRVTGQYLDNHSDDYEEPPMLRAEEVVDIEKPRDTYLGG